jgi:hypothetical protein
VVTCLLPWLESEHAPLSALATRILDQCVEPLRPVRIDGLPVQYVVSRDADRLLVCIANHAEVPWTGRVAVRDAEAPWNACVELRTAAPLPVRRRSDGAEIDAAVGRFDVAVLQWTAGAAPTSPP